MDNVINFPARNASFIYRDKDGVFHEYTFHAKNEDDLSEKAEVLLKMREGQMTGSIIGWSDDETIGYYRQNVAV